MVVRCIHGFAFEIEMSSVFNLFYVLFYMANCHRHDCLRVKFVMDVLNADSVGFVSQLSGKCIIRLSV